MSQLGGSLPGSKKKEKKKNKKSGDGPIKSLLKVFKGSGGGGGRLGPIPGTKAYENAPKGLGKNKTTKKLSYEERKAKEWEAAKAEAAKRHAAFKANKGKSLGEKSFNKGKPKSEWVKSAYERRQKTADTDMRAAAKAKNEAFMKKHKRGKYNPKNIEKKKKKELKRQTGKPGGKYDFTTM